MTVVVVVVVQKCLEKPLLIMSTMYIYTEVPGEAALDSRLQVRPEALRSRHVFRPVTHLPLPRGPCTLLFAAIRQVR